MSFYGFDVWASDGKKRHFLFAHAAKQAAEALVEEGRVKWAKVLDCEGGRVIKTCGDEDATKEVACSSVLTNFCIALAEAPDLPERLKVLVVEDTTGGTCYVRFGSMPRISGSTKLEESVDVTLRLAPGNLDDWMAGRMSIQTVCRNGTASGRPGLAPYDAPFFR